MEKKEYLDWLGSFCKTDQIIDVQTKESFRLNPLKVSPTIFEEVSMIRRKSIPWYAHAFTLEENLQLGNTMEFSLGYIHTQSLGSMIPPLALDPQKREAVLDLTASPGSKTTQISALMENTGVVVANDLPEREIALISNISRLGVLNAVVSSRDARDFELKREFDRVLIDVPCSALGSNPDSFGRFSLRSSESISSVQKKLLFNGFSALKEGGTLIYSTCTYSPLENEAVIAELLNCAENIKLAPIHLDIPHETGLTDLGEEMKNCWRIYPKHLKSEGFFIAKIIKTS